MSRFDDRYLNYGDVYSIIMQAKTVDQTMNVLHLPYVEMPKWIPVAERLPEDYGTYICTCFDGCANRVTFVKWQNKLKQWILNGSRSYWKVIAWMPLPEPYKEAEK